MKLKTLVVAAGAAAVGYVLGTKAGRAQFEQIKAKADDFAHDPRVRSGVSTLAGEVKKHERVAYGVPVTTVVMGDKPGQIPLPKLAEHIKKLPKTLQPNQITDIRQRLRALDAVRPQMPIPKGPMPTSSRRSWRSRRAPPIMASWRRGGSWWSARTSAPRSPR